MDLSRRKEQFNVAYICAMAAQAGFTPSKPEVDDDSVDLALTGRNFVGGIRNPQIQLQLKCTSQDLVVNDVIRFPLSRKNYDDLRGEDLMCPRYLFVLVVPEDDQAWIEHHGESMTLHRTCYWASIKNLPDTDNVANVTVDVPLANRLTTANLRMLLQCASDGIDP